MEWWAVAGVGVVLVGMVLEDTRAYRTVLAKLNRWRRHR
jgi:hypothetical protein